MHPNFWRRSALLLSCTSILASCQVRPTPAPFGPQTALTQANTETAVTSDDRDLSRSDRARLSSLKQQLKKEAIASDDGAMWFRTLPGTVKKKTTSRNATSLNLSGSLAHFNHNNAIEMLKYATVKAMVGGKSLATTLTDEKGNWNLRLDKTNLQGQLKIVYELGNTRWSVGDGSVVYRWVGYETDDFTSDRDTGTHTLDPKQTNGQAALIHQTWSRAQRFFVNQGVDLAWWKRQVETVWPADGDYYNWSGVHLTEAKHWDVNAHEIGHAIDHLAFASSGGGGSHKIDECYTDGLAWGEGWASFFAAAIHLRADDPDAKFEFLVPRRAPIRIEHVPTDVCNGHKNEWRVTATLWDVYDKNEDNADTLALDFKVLWETLSPPSGSKPSLRSFMDAYRLLKPRLTPEDQAKLDAVMRQNTMSVSMADE